MDNFLIILLLLETVVFVIIVVVLRNTTSHRMEADNENKEVLNASQQELSSVRRELDTVKAQLSQTQDELTRTEEYYYIRQILHEVVVDLFSGDVSVDEVTESELDVTSGVKTLPGERYVYMLTAQAIPALWELDGMVIKEMLQRRINNALGYFATDIKGRRLIVEYAFGRDGVFLIVVGLRATDMIDNNIYEEVDRIWDSLGLPAQI